MKNIAIHSENLSCLKSLANENGILGYSLKVDVIYIDPPYNVGGYQGYKNMWTGKSKKRQWAGKSGSFLDFIEPRLNQGRILLKDEGVIFVSISDKEYAHLRVLMNEIFGINNYVGTLIWNKGQNVCSRHLSNIHEYVLIYAKESKRAPRLLKKRDNSHLIIQKAKELKNKHTPYKHAQKEFNIFMNYLKRKSLITSGEFQYKFLHPKTLEVFRSTSSHAQIRSGSERNQYENKELIHPITKKVCKSPIRAYRWKKETLKKISQYDEYFIGKNFIIAGEIVYGMNEKTVPRRIQYLYNHAHYALPSVIHASHYGVKDLPDNINFSNSKPIKFLKQIIGSYFKSDAIILDYFAGSGSTAHAIHSLNQEDNGKRSWIMIEEMNSTFNNVLIPRIKDFSSDESFKIYRRDNE